MDAAETIEEYKALRAKPDAKTEKPADESAATRARDEKGQFKAADGEKPREAKPREDPQARTKSIQAEIDRLTFERREAERLRDAAKAEADRFRQESQPKPKEEPAKVESFEPFEAWIAKNEGKTYEDYLDDRAEFRLERRFKAEEAKRAEIESRRQSDTVLSQHTERVTAAKAKYQDWDERAVAFNPVIEANPVPQTLYVATVTSPRSDDITYYLMTHPQEYVQLAADAKSVPVEAAAVVRRLLEQLLPTEAAPSSGPAQPTRQSRANPPPKPVGGSPSASSVDLEDLSVDEHRARYREKLRAKHER